MRRSTLITVAASLGFAFGLAACATEDTGSVTPDGVIVPPDDTSPSSGGVDKGGTKPQGPASVLDNRTTDYGSALRLAAVKLVGELPSMVEIKALDSASNKKTAYEAQVDMWLSDPRFATTMIAFWRNTFKTGALANPAMGMPSYDTAATFAAMTTVSDKPYTDLFTATTGTCPTFAMGTFTPADCMGAQPKVGIITDPGLQSQYFANMAFRRVRFIQETFVCSKFPAEYSATPVQMGGSLYTNPGNFDSITGKKTVPTAKIDFQDTSAVTCANCHVNLNKIAPLFINFDDKGAYDMTKSAVIVPVPGNPKAVRADYIPASESYAWRNDKPVTDLAGLGKAISEDPDVARCAVTRAWNFGFSRGNVVDDISPVSKSISDPLLAKFTANGFKFKALLRDVLTSDDFTKF